MKKIVLVTISILITSCERKAPSEKLRTILDQFAPKEQVFKFDWVTPINLTGEKGTGISLNPKDLVYENGEEVLDSITIKLIELPQKEDLLKANAQTISNGHWLISGGAYYIDFSSKGKRLELKEGASYQVAFQKTTNDTMSVFYGSRNALGDMNWELSEIVLEDKTYPAIMKQDSSFIKYNAEYGIDLQVDTVTTKKLDGLFTTSQFTNTFFELDSVLLKNDTIFGFEFNTTILETVPYDSLSGNTEVFSTNRLNKYWDLQNEVYQAISTNKTGWINVDRFYPDIQDRGEVIFSLDKTDLFYQSFIISKSDNLILNCYFDKDGQLKMSFPKNKSFEILVFGLIGDELLGTKKSFRTTAGNRGIKLKTKAIDIDEIEGYLNLD